MNSIVFLSVCALPVFPILSLSKKNRNFPPTSVCLLLLGLFCQHAPKYLNLFGSRNTRQQKILSKSSLDIELLSPEEVLLKHPPSYLPKKNTSFKVHKFHVFPFNHHFATKPETQPILVGFVRPGFSNDWLPG